jgi:two-component system chemotaxis response regulator CheY
LHPSLTIRRDNRRMVKDAPRVKLALVIDDSRVVRKVARRILEDLGFEVAEAGDGAEGLAWCRTEMPDTVLLDWNMPVMDGLEFLQRLRQEPGGAAPRVVFCSVENDLDRVRAALDAGADEYIMKPFDGDIVASKLALAGAL